jgi:hypothetical protein
MMKIELYAMQLIVNCNAYLYQKYGNKLYGIHPKKVGMGIIPILKPIYLKFIFYVKNFI